MSTQEKFEAAMESGDIAAINAVGLELLAVRLGYQVGENLLIQPYEAVGHGEYRHVRDAGPPVEMAWDEALKCSVGFASRNPIFCTSPRGYGRLTRKPQEVTA